MPSTGEGRRLRAVALALLMLGRPNLAHAQSEREQYTVVSTWTFDREPSGGLPRWRVWIGGQSDAI